MQIKYSSYVIALASTPTLTISLTRTPRIPKGAGYLLATPHSSNTERGYLLKTPHPSNTAGGYLLATPHPSNTAGGYLLATPHRVLSPAAERQSVPCAAIYFYYTIKIYYTPILLYC